MEAINLAGQHFGRWLVLDQAASDSKGARWRCRCDCGTVRAVRGGNLRSGMSTSCGCIAAEAGRPMRVSRR